MSFCSRRGRGGHALDYYGLEFREVVHIVHRHAHQCKAGISGGRS